mmetsp:Transcript_122678/g.281246  ORF Transcript_122678/g.281246 Transcript_122678/m.281246 type:complete len:106 (-) Transcript_122678:344-661(-)
MASLRRTGARERFYRGNNRGTRTARYTSDGRTLLANSMQKKLVDLSLRWTLGGMQGTGVWWWFLLCAREEEGELSRFVQWMLRQRQSGFWCLREKASYVISASLY